MKISCNLLPELAGHHPRAWWNGHGWLPCFRFLLKACQARAPTSEAMNQPAFPSLALWLAWGLGVSVVGCCFCLAESELLKRDGHFVIELCVSLKKNCCLLISKILWFWLRNLVLTFKIGILRSPSDSPPPQISQRMLFFLSFPLGLMPYLALSSHLLFSLFSACPLVTFLVIPCRCELHEGTWTHCYWQWREALTSGGARRGVTNEHHLDFTF